MGGGCSLPVMIVLFGDLANTFVTRDYDINEVCNYVPKECCQNGKISFNSDCPLSSNDTRQYTNDNFNFLDEITRFGMGTAIIGFINFIMSYVFVTCLNHAAEAQVFKIRRLFLQGILRQDIGWYDTHQTTDFAAKMAE